MADIPRVLFSFNNDLLGHTKIREGDRRCRRCVPLCEMLRSRGGLKQVEFKTIWYISVRHLPPPERHKSHETGELLVNREAVPNRYQHEMSRGRKEGEKTRRDGEQPPLERLINPWPRGGYVTARSESSSRALHVQVSDLRHTLVQI